MRYGPWPRSGRLLRHFSFSSSFLRGPNPGGPGHVKGALAHRAQRGLPWTWPRRDYIAHPEEEEKAPQQSAAACGCQGPATAMVPAVTAGGEGKEHAPATGARQYTARPVKDRSTYPGSAATHEGCGGTLPPHYPPAHARAASGTSVRLLSPCTHSACDRGPPAPMPAWHLRDAPGGCHPAAAVLLVSAAIGKTLVGDEGREESTARAERSGAGAFRQAPWGAARGGKAQRPFERVAEPTGGRNGAWQPSSARGQSSGDAVSAAALTGPRAAAQTGIPL